MARANEQTDASCTLTVSDHRTNLPRSLGRFAFVAGGLALTLAAACGATEVVDDSVDRDYSDELQRIASTAPADALRRFETLPGFRVELVASEPLVQDPVAMAFDEYGRLYVVEMRGYSEDGDQRLGAVKLLTDDDDDGRFDHSTVYLDGLSWPTAIACWSGGVLVGASGRHRLLPRRRRRRACRFGRRCSPASAARTFKAC